ncbi:unannotated protein [freshwater metagenome]|uniref:Unannotated protein n=1 Tax=freshwater metagenome TaxID=449393 RepID=A0A6J6TGZ4_9ZZZZ|nr:alpha/beta fold hydrolase [Actinomycetota bacterium]
MIVRYGFTRIAAAAVGIATAAAAFVLPTTAVRAADTPAGLDAYYAQVLEWTSCSSGLSCAWLTVPLDYAKPDGQTIRLRVGKAAMTGPAEGRQGSLVVNPGGPGAPAVDFARSVADGIAPNVAKSFDVVGFDPRGVGLSQPIVCMTGEQTTRWLQADQSPDTPAEVRRLMRLSADLAKGCLTKSPLMARHVGTENTVRDMDILRQALGDSSLNFLGFSYGTYLGTLYAEQFPERVGRFVLDGALDPSLDLMEISKGQSGGFQVAMQRFAKDCSRRDSCPYAGSAANVLGGINALLAQLDRKPMKATGSRRLLQSDAVTALFTSMYSETMWPSLRSALEEAVKGDGSGLLDLADYANDRTGPNSYSGNLTSAFIAISCWDTPAPPGAAGLARAAAKWSKGAGVPVMARTMSWGNAPCSQWYGRTGRVPAPASSTTTAPILIVGTTYDPATPYSWSVALNRQLPTSTLLTYQGDGHTAYGGESACINRLIDAYLIKGVQPAARTVCR